MKEEVVVGDAGNAVATATCAHDERTFATHGLAKSLDIYLSAVDYRLGNAAQRLVNCLPRITLCADPTPGKRMNIAIRYHESNPPALAVRMGRCLVRQPASNHPTSPGEARTVGAGVTSPKAKAAAKSSACFSERTVV